MIIIKKTSGILWQYCRNEPAINGYGAIVNFNAANVSKLLNTYAKITVKPATV